MVCHHNQSLRLRMTLIVLATVVNVYAALPPIWLHHDLIGSHFSEKNQLTPRTRPISQPAKPNLSPSTSRVAFEQQIIDHQPEWYKNLLESSVDVEDTRHQRSHTNELDSGPLPHHFSDLGLDLEALLREPIEMNLGHESPELSDEDQEFLLESLAEGLELQTNLEKLIESRSRGVHAIRRRSAKPLKSNRMN